MLRESMVFVSDFETVRASQSLIIDEKSTFDALNTKLEKLLAFKATMDYEFESIDQQVLILGNDKQYQNELVDSAITEIEVLQKQPIHTV